MNKEFIPYEQALELKELGFNEECLGYYHTTLASNDVDLIVGKTPDRFYYLIKIPEHFDTLAPLYQQASRFFREKYGLNGYVGGKSGKYYWQMDSFIETDGVLNQSPYLHYSDAELECLKKLIEIVKNK